MLHWLKCPNLLKGIFTLFFIGIGILQIHSQPFYKDTLYLKESNVDHLSTYYYYYLEPEAQHAPVQIIDSLFKEGRFKRWHKPGFAFNPGLAQSDIWLRVTVKNTIEQSGNFLWTVYNHMDSVYLFKKLGAEYNLQSSLSGNTTALHRPFNTRNFALPFKLSENESATLFLKLINRAKPFYVVTDITTTIDYIAYEERFLIRTNWYWLIGFFFFAALFNFILYFLIKDPVHLWYTAYVFFISLFLLMEDGLDGLIFPEWLYRILWRIDQHNFLLLSAACGIGIMQSFIKQNKKSLLYRVCRVTLLLDIIFVIVNTIIFPLFRDAHNYTAGLWLSYIGNVLIVFSVLITIASLTDGIIRKNKLAWYYSFAFVFFLYGATIFFLNNAGISVKHHVQPNALAIGLFWELLLLLFFITVRFHFLVKDNLRLHINELEQQKKAAAQIILAQDEEKHRLAKDLHDDLGNTMTRIRLLLLHQRKTGGNNEETTMEMENLVKKAAKDIRNISHQLMPADLEEEGLEASLKKMCTFLSTHSGTACQFFFSGMEEKISLELRLVVYRIFTELSGNIVKHANATQAVMQCIIYDTYILISAEDNGKGIEPGTDKNGIGLKNIRSRVQLLKGKINIDSGEAGTTIIIEIPI